VGSPAYGDVLPGAPVAVAYRGAFSGPADNWADGWTALSSQGYLLPVVVIGDVTVGGGTLSLTVPSVTGISYQLQSKSPITGPWMNVGSPIPGNGGPIVFAPPIGSGDEYFRISATPVSP
jgi:hypothetical protein